MLDSAKAITGTLLTSVLGRRNLARMARFLTSTARLDGPNDLQRNGESLVREIVVARSPQGRPLVVFDVGANIGEWTLQLIEAAEKAARPDLILHAFEPVASTMQALRQNLKDHGQVVLQQIALSNQDGTAQISIVGEMAGTNAITPDPACAIQHVETVNVRTVDLYCRERRISQIALLKIDAEGHDLFVLRGAEQMLRSQSIAVAQFEYNHRWIWSRVYLRDVFEFAGQINYRVGKVTPRGIEFYKVWHPELEKFQEGNYLLCRADWVAQFPKIEWWNAEG